MAVEANAVTFEDEVIGSEGKVIVERAQPSPDSYASPGRASP